MKERRNAKELVLRMVLLLIGLTIAHLGVTMFLVTELGTDTFTIFVQGLSNLIGITIGQMHVIVLCIITIIMLVFAKGYIKAGSVVCAVCGGWIIDFFLWLFDGRISGDSTMIVRFVTMALGCVVLAVGMSLVIRSDAGTGPNDLVAIVITDKLKRFQFRYVRIACDATFTLIGFLLGGTIGIGTVVAIMLTGPVVQFFLPISEKLVNLLVKKIKVE